ncbi:hypothetical protein [Parabacteroides gordonii]|uniref:Uncharacterized protein n=1 Tax=Parabacteroides gordonii MS-1 = DSM 23371 TaxID=1203610 RepID=A0A0F5JDU3_9BACT|nr:hypothetical protein [Parabacteroides gordonii]KKB55670.1 hypothetical protein HMPREF1536_03142 [Parabacteroides gordonii MS-1 = DSM 23371]MCA5581545.1 hypothetical protein [Parabacteroides gordonii]
MIKQLAFILTLFLTTESYGQQLSVELSIEWMKSISFSYRNKGIDSIPYLKITYNNLSDKYIYFPKVYQNTVSLPSFSQSIRNTCYKADTFCKENSSVVKWNVFIGGMYPNNHVWEVLPDSVDYFSERENEVMNDALYSVYASLFDTLIYEKLESDTLDDDVISQDLLSTLKDDLVFLQPKGKYSDYYSLVGFEILKGDYTFLLPTDKMLDFIEIDSSLDNEESKRINLPNQIDKYFLYKGLFSSNKISILFR